jgi:hypothetical protein
MRSAFRVPRSALVAFVGALMLAGCFAQAALADATPVQFVLVYMPNVSNTGTTAASGIAELVMLEGEVRISATDLPRLEGDKQYFAWVVNTERNEFQRVGAFNSAQSTSAVRYENVLPDAIPNKHWNLLLITVEDSANPTRPSNKHSIAGVFPRAENEPLPVLLPNTGGTSGIRSQMSDGVWADWRLTSVLAALVLSVTFSAGYAAGRRRAGRH